MTTTQTQRRLLNATAKAAQQGVSVKTLDRRVERKRMKEPLIINGRKYYDADDQPISDDAVASTASDAA